MVALNLVWIFIGDLTLMVEMFDTLTSIWNLKLRLFFIVYNFLAGKQALDLPFEI